MVRTDSPSEIVKALGQPRPKDEKEKKDAPAVTIKIELGD